MLSKLYKIFIEPIEEYLPSDPSEVIIIPDSFLFVLPYASFYDKKSEKYIIDKHCITISPSIQMIKLKRDLRNDKRLIEALLNSNNIDGKSTSNANCKWKEIGFQKGN
jgi:CHAT domain-containing protein